MHNVLSIIEKDFLKLDENGRDSINLRDNCFDYLFLQGFWKKLVFLMDVDSALELTKSVGDRESFKLLYLVYKCNIKDGAEIKEIIANCESKDFHELTQKDVNQ
jgi:hypothetical protein